MGAVAAKAKDSPQVKAKAGRAGAQSSVRRVLQENKPAHTISSKQLSTALKWYFTNANARKLDIAYYRGELENLTGYQDLETPVLLRATANEAFVNLVYQAQLALGLSEADLDGKLGVGVTKPKIDSWISNNGGLPWLNLLPRKHQKSNETNVFELKQKHPNIQEKDASGLMTKKIVRGDSEFNSLVKNDNPEIIFKQEEGTDADRLMTPKLKQCLNILAEKVSNEWPGVKLRVTEAWDEDSEHSGKSTHYEGRGADLTTWPKNPSQYGRLAALARDSGFDWVFYENKFHVHVSVKKSSFEPPTLQNNFFLNELPIYYATIPNPVDPRASYYHNYPSDNERPAQIENTSYRIREPSIEPLTIYYSSIPDPQISQILYDDKFIENTKKPLENSHSTTSLFSLRETPSKHGKILGELQGKNISVDVLDKRQSMEIEWYKIKLNEDCDQIKAGTECWIGAKAITPVIDWEEFKLQLHDFESDNSHLSRAELITKARQWSHDEALPFDDVIGSNSGKEYLDTREYTSKKWQFLKDAQKVKMPDGKLVDIYHALVGLEVLGNKIEDATYYGFRIGSNYSAALFAGDIGAAVADAVSGKDKDWEKRNKIPSELKERRKHIKKILNHYYISRAPESDLLADIDSFGLYNLLENSSDKQSLESVISKYYEDITKNSEKNSVLSAARFNAIKNYFLHYELKPEKPLLRQLKAFQKIYEQILYFANIWYLRNEKFSVISSEEEWIAELKLYSKLMTYKFISWLEVVAEENGVFDDTTEIFNQGAWAKKTPVQDIYIGGGTSPTGSTEGDWRNDKGQCYPSSELINLKAYIFYDPSPNRNSDDGGFPKQAEAQYKNLTNLYGENRVALSGARSEREFKADWKAMRGAPELIVVNFHGTSQAIHLDSNPDNLDGNKDGEYLVSTSSGKTNISSTQGYCIKALSNPNVELNKCGLYMNTCYSMNSEDMNFKDGETIANAFSSLGFQVVRATPGKVEIDEKTGLAYPARKTPFFDYYIRHNQWIYIVNE